MEISSAISDPRHFCNHAESPLAGHWPETVIFSIDVLSRFHPQHFDHTKLTDSHRACGAGMIVNFEKEGLFNRVQVFVVFSPCWLSFSHWTSINEHDIYSSRTQILSQLLHSIPF